MINAALCAVLTVGCPMTVRAEVPNSIMVATTRGVTTVPVTAERGYPALSVVVLAGVLPISHNVEGDWAVVAFADQPFRFLLDSPLFVFRDQTVPLVGGAYHARDTVFVPLQWLTQYIPRVFREAYRYDPVAARFEEARLTPVAATSPAVRQAYRTPAPGSAAARNGFRMVHKVVVDPGHGGSDPGNPGRYFRRGIKEKDITLGIGSRLRDELEKRGVEVIMTRTEDVAVRVMDRAPQCRDDCDLFVSVHVNSLEQRPGYENVSGFETYFLDDARTAEAARVAQMENEALRYEPDVDLDEGELAFIYKDLHTNEYLRESAQLADFVQRAGARVHPGRDRGTSQARFFVLSYASRPAILVETGFATNPGDAKYLASATGQQRLAAAIAEGIVGYLRRYEEKVLAGLGR